MTDPAPKQRRNGILIVIAALVVVCMWWAVFLPQTRQYKIYKREIKLKETLKAIKPAAGTTEGNFFTNHHTFSTNQQTADLFSATGVYVTTSDCASVKTYYKAEFARRGLTFQGEKKDKGSKDPDISFSSQDYDVSVSCSKALTPRMIYIIEIHSTYVFDKHIFAIPLRL